MSVTFPVRGHSGKAAQTALVGNHTAVDDTLECGDLSTWVGIDTDGPFWITIDRGLPSDVRRPPPGRGP
jgi:hypothetical protein